MLFADGASLAFIEIPKNGSKSIKLALEAGFGLDSGPIARDLGLTPEEFDAAYQRGRVAFNPVVDTSNVDHLSLANLALHMPGTLAAFRQANSFALVRQPRGRFISALLQRLGQFDDHKNLRADDPIVQTEARQTCDWLDGRGVFADTAYIHFTRQVDFVDLDGERVVDAVFPIERTDAAAAWVEQVTGKAIHIAHEHARREPKSWAKLVQPPARFIGRHLIPTAVKRVIYPLWRNSRVFDDASKSYGVVELGDDVEAFIASYYAADARLYDEARAAVAAPAPADRIAS